MSQVRLQVAPDAAHVRVVRLVAVSLARVHGVDEDVVEDVRLAVGEACGRAVAAHARASVVTPIRLAFDGTPGLTVDVADGVSLPEADGERAVALLAGRADGESAGADADAAPVVMALLEGLADEVSVHTGADGTTVQLRWTRRP